MIIAIDGPAASGKGTLSRRLAAELGLAHLDTGMLYRAVARKLLDRGIDPDDADKAAEIASALNEDDLARDGLRGEDTGQAASKVAAVPAVREALLAFQRRFAARPGGAVLDGRDIGTVVCPDADFKLFVTADVETRARRRHKELRQQGGDSIFQEVLDEMRRRDARDQSRAVAPLKPAEDALVLDTTEMDADEAFERALAFIAEKKTR